MGMGIGAAMTGLRPIVEGMNMGFLLLAYNQISNNAGMLHYTSGGQYKVGPRPGLRCPALPLNRPRLPAYREVQHHHCHLPIRNLEGIRGCCTPLLAPPSPSLVARSLKRATCAWWGGSAHISNGYAGAHGHSWTGRSRPPARRRAQPALGVLFPVHPRSPAGLLAPAPPPPPAPGARASASTAMWALGCGTPDSPLFQHG